MSSRHKTPEGATLAAVLSYLSLCGIFHFRNNTGGTPLHDGSGRYRPAPKSSVGSPDIIGIATAPCDNEGGFPRCGFPHPLPLAVEVKSAKGLQSPAQREFQRKWEAAGGIYLIARSVPELRAKLRECGVAAR